MTEATPHPPLRHSGRGHLAALDGVRGLAILLVLSTHAFEGDPSHSGPLIRFIYEVFRYGIVGVDLFFVLSGFLITGILMDTREDPRFFRKFYSRRALRIFPLYYGVLLVLLVLTPLLHLDWQGMGLLLFTDLQNWRAFTIENLVLSNRFGLYHFWSLAVEEQFYFLWPAVVFLCRTRRTLRTLTLTLCFAALLLRLGMILLHVGIFDLHVNTFCRADSLLIGGLLAQLYRSAAWPRAARLAPPVFFVGFTLALGLVIAPVFRFRSVPYWLWAEGFYYTVIALGFAGLVAWSLSPASIAERIFSLRFFRFFGKYSYGIYVLHVLILTSLDPFLRARVLVLTHNKAIAVAASGLLCLGLSVIAALISFHLYEKPFLRLKKYFDYTPSPAV